MNFGQFGDDLLQHILNPPHLQDIILENIRIDVVMDVNDGKSIKDQEHNLRLHKRGHAALSALPTAITGHEQLLPSSMEAFLDETSNKAQLVKFLSDYWLKKAPALLKNGQSLIIGGGLNRQSYSVTHKQTLP